MLPEHKNAVNGRNNQGNKKIILEPIEKLSELQKPPTLTTTSTSSISTTSSEAPESQPPPPPTIINFQTITNNNDTNHITTLGGSTPKKNHHFTIKTQRHHKISAKSIQTLTAANNRKAYKQRTTKRIQCLSFQENFTSETQYRRGRRLNGIQLPLHPLQVFGWIILILFGLASFIILIPTFTIEIQQPLYGLLGGLYIVHTVSHIAALLIDPADRELRRVHRNDRIVPEFDRTKHSHVIENGRCHLCNIRTTSNRTKHCSVCNKCVGKFDHHCKWLNHCIGGRNYVAFLMCVVSAVIATLVILAAAIAQIVLFYVNPDWLNLWYSTATKLVIENDVGNGGGGSRGDVVVGGGSSGGAIHSDQTLQLLNDSGLNVVTGSTGDDILAILVDDTLSIFNQTFDDGNNDIETNLTTIIAEAIVTAITKNDTDTASGTIANTDPTESTESTVTGGIGLHDTIFLIFTGILGVLAAITAGLLLHLCFFHIYISFLGLTTYEYIRNHRQNAAAANVPTNVPPSSGKKNTPTNPNQLDPSKLTNKRNSQMYFCSNLNHPNDLQNSNLDLSIVENERPTSLHCCENSREYHQTSLKTIYMCSMLEESSSTTTTSTIDSHHLNSNYRNGNNGHDIIAGSQQYNNNNSKTFHCCSQFQKNQLDSNDIEQQSSMHRRRAAATILHFTEQCTFCTFRVKTPTKSETVSLQDKRCCLKTITKHHRWRRKWNCCSNVPDSPDVPNDIISSLSNPPIPGHIPNTSIQSLPPAQHHFNNNNNNNNNRGNSSGLNPTQIPANFIKVNGSSSSNNNGGDDLANANLPPRLNLKATRPKLVRPWPVTRFRHMLRMIGRYRRPRCRHVGGANNGGNNNIGAVKQNQVRPIPNLQQSSCSSSGDDDGMSTGSDSTTQSIETILPTSVIRDHHGGIYITGELTMPVLPPPARRKIPNPTDLDELAETLGFPHSSQQQQQHHHQQQRFLNSNSAYRRQRRKNLLRTRSPTLSPIHESGLSNPTSPQPCRHSSSSCAGTIVTNSCGIDGSSVMIIGDNSKMNKN